MPASPSPCSPSVIAARLRAAGCVFAEDEATLLIASASAPADLTAMVDQRVAGLPLEQVIGWAEFCGLRIAVAPGVFVPRRRTEFLVSQALAVASQEPGRTPGPAPGGTQEPAPGGTQEPAAAGPGTPPPNPAADARAARPRPRLVVVDLCCGAGAVGAALAASLGQIELHAVDIDPAAVRCARRNLAAVAGQVYQGDLYEPLPTALHGRVGLMTANVPYVPTGEIALLPAEARVHEARVALDGGPDGLDVLRRVAAAAPGWLAPGGSMLAETSERQAPRAAEVISRAGLLPRLASSAEHYATVIIGTKPDRPG